MQKPEFRHARNQHRFWTRAPLLAAATVLAVLAATAVAGPASAAPGPDQKQGKHPQAKADKASNDKAKSKKKPKFRNKIVPYVISDPALVNHPGRVTRELRKHGDLSGLGVSPARKNGPSRVAGQMTVNSEPRNYVVDSSRFPGGRIPADMYDYAEADECSADGSPAYNNDGWIKNRYSYCQIHLLVMPAYRCGIFPPRCNLVGNYMSRNTVIGYGKAEGWWFQGLPEWRYANFYLDVDVLESSGPFNSRNATMEAEIECDGDYRGDPPDGVDDDNACTPGGNDVTERAVKEWENDPGANFDIGSEGVTPSAGAGEQIATGVFKFDYDFSLPGQWFQFLDPESPEGGMRFDSAWYNTQSKMGSVFDRAVPGFSYSKSDSAVVGVADHIDDARTNPAASRPFKTGKVFHGATASDPIHRLARAKGSDQRARAADNRRISTNFCRTAAMPAQPPTGGPFDCDEYSFASTYEGSARFIWENNSQYELDYSVRWVNRSQNQEAGRRLGRWYENDRILDNERFFVPIVP